TCSRLFLFKQKAAYEISRDWSSDVCSSDLELHIFTIFQHDNICYAICHCAAMRPGIVDDCTTNRSRYTNRPFHTCKPLGGTFPQIGRASCRERVERPMMDAVVVEYGITRYD